MRNQIYPCPVCHISMVNLFDEGDDVDFTCSHCGGHFTAAEARRGHLFVAQETLLRRVASLENRVEYLEDRLGIRVDGGD
jgi:transcription initiation factor IIE alpha subunit